MLRFIGAFGLALIVSTLAPQAPVHADSLSRQTGPCTVPPLNEPSPQVERLGLERAVRANEVIVEGVIESYSPPDLVSDVRGPGVVIVHVEKVWKGVVTQRIAYLIFPIGYLSTEWQPPSVPCPVEAPVGRRIRLAGEFEGKVGERAAGYPGLDANTNILGLRALYGGYLPLSDPELDRLLAAYQAKTDTLQQAAATGGRREKLAFADYLLANSEKHRAFEVYDALLRESPNDLDLMLALAVARTKARMDDEPEATLAIVKTRAPNTEKWLSKIARARLAATGVLTADGKDWTDLKRMHTTCYSDHENFDGAVFDRAELAECAFRYSSLRNASFRGTDLTGSYFQDSDLTGAVYDCATKLPDDLDPVAAGMINVAGSCPATAP